MRTHTDTRKRGNANDIFDHLRRDHDSVDRLLDELEGSDEHDGARRERLFAQLVRESETCSQVEDDVLYTTLEQTPMFADRIEDCRQEHQHLEDLLEEIDDLDATEPHWIDRIRDFRQAFQRLLEEEAELYRAATDALGGAARVQLGRAYARGKAEAAGDLSGEIRLRDVERRPPGT